MKFRPPKYSVLVLILFFLAGALGGFFLRDRGVSIDPASSVVEVRSFGNNGSMVSSGFLIEDGIVITTSHGIGDPTSELFVHVPEIGEFSAGLLAMDSDMDVAALKITANAGGLPHLKLSDSDRLELGQEVRTATGTGIITDLNSIISAAKSLMVKDFSGILQFNAQVDSGSSGGPLLDAENKVIGVIVVHTPENDDLNFAIPINAVKDFLEKESIEF